MNCPAFEATVIQQEHRNSQKKQHYRESPYNWVPALKAILLLTTRNFGHLHFFNSLFEIFMPLLNSLCVVHPCQILINIIFNPPMSYKVLLITKAAEFLVCTKCFFVLSISSFPLKFYLQSVQLFIKCLNELFLNFFHF